MYENIRVAAHDPKYRLLCTVPVDDDDKLTPYPYETPLTNYI